jgi:hypothetical protein
MAGVGGNLCHPLTSSLRRPAAVDGDGLGGDIASRIAHQKYSECRDFLGLDEHLLSYGREHAQAVDARTDSRLGSTGSIEMRAPANAALRPVCAKLGGLGNALPAATSWVPKLVIIMRLRHSALIERTKRSANAFKFGARGGRRMTSMPSRTRMLRKASQYFVSRTYDSDSLQQPGWRFHSIMSSQPSIADSSRFGD